MAMQISINTEVAAEIYTNSKSMIEELRDLLGRLTTEIEKLPNEGEWKGDAQVRFFNEYEEVKPKITEDMPSVLDQISENLDTNLQNLIEADASNA